MTTVPPGFVTNVGEVSVNRNCRACNQPDEADSRMVQCDGCSHWYHFKCAGVGDSIADESRTYICAFCSASPAASVSQSTTASAREAKLRLDMQRLAEEKELRARLLAEKEKQEKDMQEMAMRLEKERRDKAIADLMILEKEFIDKKYELLQARLEEDDEGRSTRSRRSARQDADRIREWMNTQRADTVSANPGEVVPTGLMSVATNVAHPSSVPTFGESSGQRPIATAGEISCATTFAPTFKDLISPVTLAHSVLPVETITSSPSNVQPTPLQQSTPRSAAVNVMEPVSVLPRSTYINAQHGLSFPNTSTAAVSNRPTVQAGLAGNLVHPPSSEVIPRFIPGPNYNQPVGSVPQSSVGNLPVISSISSALESRVPASLSLNPPWGDYAPVYPSVLPGDLARSSVFAGGGAAIPHSAPSVPIMSQNSIPPSFSMPIDSRGIYNLSSQHYPGISVSSYQAPIFSMPRQSNLPIQQLQGPNSQQLAARHVVPKELPSFSGNPAEWPLFWSSFETSTQMCGYTDAENLMRLQRSLKGDARKAVSCFLLHPTNVPEVMNTLHSLYGRPEAIIHTLLNEVRATPAPRHDKLDTLINFGLAVRNLCVHLVSTRQEMHLVNPILLQELVEKLPANIKLDWALYRQRELVADLRAFADYMNVLVTAASSVTTITEQSGQKPDVQKGKAKAFVNPHSTESTRAEWRTKEGTKTEESSSEFKPDRPCVVCKINGHKPKDCDAFKHKSLADRWKIANEVHLCKRCLYPHGRWPCKAPACGVNGCQQRHHRLLHPGEPQPNRTSATVTTTTGTVSVHRHLQSKILFRIVPVILHANGKSIRTFAFLDSGSDATLVDNSIVKRLGIVGQPTPLCMQWTNGVKRTEEESQSVQLYISGIDSTKRFVLNGVHTVKKLDLPQQSLRFENFERDFPHLRGLPVKSYDNALPGILIGLDNTKIETPLKLREGKPDEPVAAKTRIGWVVFGRSGGSTENPFRHVLHLCSRSGDDTLHDLVKDFFRVEGTGITSPAALDSADDVRAREILRATTVRTPNGRFQTGLLWKYDRVEFPNSRPMAERRLLCLEKRLQKSPELYSNVKQQIISYQEKGYAHIATDKERQHFFCTSKTTKTILKQIRNDS
ncbi:uncharacterized protein LOC134290073 [Aedes albopictus]|uniref:PHD-type domain-containing protein n=1 Tax=Aedes albopictus TaxID=7160 RepID=A0ABM1ZPI0_AEDAL